MPENTPRTVCAVTGIGIGDQSLVGTGKQQEAETKENDHGRYCDNAERDQVEQGNDIALQRPSALIRGIGERVLCFAELRTRVSEREPLCQLIEQPRRERSVGHLAIALSQKHISGYHAER